MVSTTTSTEAEPGSSSELMQVILKVVMPVISSVMLIPSPGPSCVIIASSAHSVSSGSELDVQVTAPVLSVPQSRSVVPPLATTFGVAVIQTTGVSSSSESSHPRPTHGPQPSPVHPPFPPPQVSVRAQSSSH